MNIPVPLSTSAVTISCIVSKFKSPPCWSAIALQKIDFNLHLLDQLSQLQ